MSDEAVDQTEATLAEAKDGTTSRLATLATIDFHSIEPSLGEEWQRQSLPAWLEQGGERVYIHRETRARLCRYIATWDDGTWQEMWSVYVSSNRSPDSVCVRLDLALEMHERHRRSGFLRKGELLPWRT